MQMWTAAVTVQGRGVTHGSPELAPLTEVTDHIAMDVTHASYDRSANTATVTLRLKNTSAQTLRGPMKARVLGMKSELGVPRIAGSGAGGVGTIIDFTAALPAGELKRGERSAEKTVTFELKDLRPFRQGQALKNGLVELDTRIYAPAPDPSNGTRD